MAAVLQATIPIFGIFFAHVMLPDEPLQLPKLLGVLLALGGVTLICGRLLGFNSPLAFWDGMAVVVGAASGLRQRVSQGALDPACARHARGVVVDFDQIDIAPIKPAIEHITLHPAERLQATLL